MKKTEVLALYGLFDRLALKVIEAGLLVLDFRTAEAAQVLNECDALCINIQGVFERNISKKELDRYEESCSEQDQKKETASTGKANRAR